MLPQVSYVLKPGFFWFLIPKNTPKKKHLFLSYTKPSNLVTTKPWSTCCVVAFPRPPLHPDHLEMFLLFRVTVVFGTRQRPQISENVSVACENCYIWVFPYMVITPKSSILIGFSIIFTIHFGVKPPIFGNTHMLVQQSVSPAKSFVFNCQTQQPPSILALLTREK